MTVIVEQLSAQLLPQSSYLLFQPENKWTESQQARAKIFFELYPDLKHAYNLSMNFRNIYQNAKDKEDAINNSMCGTKKQKMNKSVLL